MSTLRVNTLQNTSTTDGGISIDNSGNVTLPANTKVGTQNLPSAGPLSNRNLVINGAMQVAQRSSSPSTGTGYVTLDRWSFERGSGVQQVSQQTLSSGDPYDEGFRSFARTLNFTVSTSTNNFRRIYQRIEAQNLAESGWNYSSATSYITLSFWARASVAQTYYIRLETNDGTAQSYSSGFALAADTWTKVTKTIPGNSNITINTDNGVGLQLEFIPYYGTDFTTSGHTDDAWAAYDSASRVPDMTTTWNTTDDATFDVTGVQLEVGQVATPFEHRSFGDELARCQRYYQKMIVEDIKFACSRWDQSSGVGECNVYLRETMRLAPTFAFTGTWDTGTGWGGDPVMTLARPDVVVLTTTVSTVAASGVKVLRSETTDASISFAAEL